MAERVTRQQHVLGVLLTGSYARGSADDASDLDLRVLVREPPPSGYRTWFESRPGSRPLHISLGISTVAEWQASSSHPADWSLGFPVRVDAVWGAALPETRRLVGDDPSRIQPAAAPELEDLVESLVKVRRAASTGGIPVARLHAHDAAALVPRALRVLDPGPVRVVIDRADALAAALALPVVPEGYIPDMLAALGLRDAGAAEVVAAATRLGRGALALLRVYAPDADPQPGVREALADGTLEDMLSWRRGRLLRARGRAACTAARGLRRRPRR